MTDPTAALRTALEAKRREYEDAAEQAQVDYNEFHAGGSGRAHDSAKTAPMRWNARAEGIEAALSILNTTPQADDPSDQRPFSPYDPEHPDGAFCANTTGLPICYHDAPQADDPSGPVTAQSLRVDLAEIRRLLDQIESYSS
jgi:hypothetical protein